MIRFPNAKINLGLHIVSKRVDGYHNIETIFYPVKLKDALEIVESKGIKDTLHISGIQVDGSSDDNLVMKALRLVREEHHIPNLDIYLHKVIPFGAGLGGGSADAAAMLQLLNDKYDLQYSETELVEKATRLGADCAFFILNKPVFAKGIGNEFESLDISLKGYYLLLIKPPVYVSTPEAYSLVVPHLPEVSLKDLALSPVDRWHKSMKNDFEQSVFDKYPVLQRIKSVLIENGAVYAAMSGSGSSLFGIFEKAPDFSVSLFEDCFVWQGELD